jgi:hypothetical protein
MEDQPLLTNTTQEEGPPIAIQSKSNEEVISKSNKLETIEEDSDHWA